MLQVKSQQLNQMQDELAAKQSAPDVARYDIYETRHYDFWGAYARRRSELGGMLLRFRACRVAGSTVR
jgi:hypothetical protein